MEIYRNNTAEVELKVPATAINNTLKATAIEGNVVLHTFPTVNEISGGYSVTLPFSLVQSDRTFEIKWEFDYEDFPGAPTLSKYEHSTEVNVVTPYVSLEEIKQFIPDVLDMFDTEEKMDMELRRLERRIRGVIDNFTGQSFGRYVGTRNVIGSGEEQLRLQDRLVRFDNITGSNIIYASDGVSYPELYTVRGNGRFVGFSNPLPDGVYQPKNVITDPDTVFSRGFRDNVVYTVSGVWGWEDVPSAVKEAALSLCEDALCPQSEYRDKYLKSISGDGWRYEFTPNAYYGTGSVVADRLLEPYRYNSMVVI